MAWWESYYIVFIVLISLRTSENFTGQRGRDRLGCRWAFGSLWPGRTLKFLPLSLCVSPAPLSTSPFLSSYLQTHRGTFQSSKEKHAVYQNWISVGGERKAVSPIPSPEFLTLKGKGGRGQGGGGSFPPPHDPLYYTLSIRL